MKIGLGIYQVIWYWQKSFVRGVNHVHNQCTKKLVKLLFWSLYQFINLLMHRFNMYSFVRLIIIYIINRTEHSVAIPPRHPILVLSVLLLRFNIFRHEISHIFWWYWHLKRSKYSSWQKSMYLFAMWMRRLKS